jgi:hypothetical protein
MNEKHPVVLVRINDSNIGIRHVLIFSFSLGLLRPLTSRWGRVVCASGMGSNVFVAEGGDTVPCRCTSVVSLPVRHDVFQHHTAEPQVMHACIPV